MSTRDIFESHNITQQKEKKITSHHTMSKPFVIFCITEGFIGSQVSKEDFETNARLGKNGTLVFIHPVTKREYEFIVKMPYELDFPVRPSVFVGTKFKPLAEMIKTDEHWLEKQTAPSAKMNMCFSFLQGSIEEENILWIEKIIEKVSYPVARMKSKTPDKYTMEIYRDMELQKSKVDESGSRKVYANVECARDEAHGFAISGVPIYVPNTNANGKPKYKPLTKIVGCIPGGVNGNVFAQIGYMFIQQKKTHRIFWNVAQIFSSIDFTTAATEVVGETNIVRLCRQQPAQLDKDGNEIVNVNQTSKFPCLDDGGVGDDDDDGTLCNALLTNDDNNKLSQLKREREEENEKEEVKQHPSKEVKLEQTQEEKEQEEYLQEVDEIEEEFFNK